MLDLIQISKLNDFIFCPYSIYLHSIYESFHQHQYHRRPQKIGKLHHRNIDTKKYSSLKNKLQGTSISSQQYGLVGKLDILDLDTKTLIERKYKIHKIYEGHKYQLYAEYFCLQEVGYDVKKLAIHSLSDNKRYFIPLPDDKEIKKFLQTLNAIRNFKISTTKFTVTKNKCQHCIYRQLCSFSLC